MPFIPVACPQQLYLNNSGRENGITAGSILYTDLYLLIISFV